MYLLTEFICYLKQECIPVGCVPSAEVAICRGGVCLGGSAQAGCLPGGCLPRGCLPRTGVVVVSRHALRQTPCGQNDRQV